MKIWLVLLITAWAVATAHAAFGASITCDPEATGTSNLFVYQEGASPPVPTPLVQVAPSTLFSCKADVSGFSVGTHSLQTWFASTVWGVTSVKVPFSFTRPAVSATGPANLQLVP